MFKEEQNFKDAFKVAFFSRFIEYGEYRGNLYGTNIDSVRFVLAKNKVCLLDVQCQVSRNIASKHKRLTLDFHSSHV